MIFVCLLFNYAGYAKVTWELRAVPVATGPYDFEIHTCVQSVGCPYEIEPLAMFWSHANGWCLDDFLRDFYSFVTMFCRRGRKNPYGYRTVTVCCMYGSVRCMCEHCTDPYMLQNTRRIIRSLYMARECPGDDRECTCGLLAPYDCLRAFCGEKRCACTIFRHGLLTGTRGIYRLQKPVQLRAGPCGPARYAIRSPTGHWNFGPYGARKLHGSSMWPRYYIICILCINCCQYS